MKIARIKKYLIAIGMVVSTVTYSRAQYIKMTTAQAVEEVKSALNLNSEQAEKLALNFNKIAEQNDFCAASDSLTVWSNKLVAANQSGNKLKQELASKQANFYMCKIIDIAVPAIEEVTNADQKIKLERNVIDFTRGMRGKPGSELIGKLAPNFTMPDTSGKLVSLSYYRGKYILLDFWASWCVPCRGENPNVLAAYSKFKDRNFTVIGVSLDNKKQAWLAAIQKDKLSWTQLSDLNRWKNSASLKYNVSGIPQNFLIAPDGKVIAAALRGDELFRKLDEVLPK